MKSSLHQTIQQTLQRRLPKGEASLEYPLGELIADIAWPKKKLVFEVQCSPISILDAKRRTEGYLKEGFTPIWILHQKTFNQHKISDGEGYLRKATECYYTDITELGQGRVYDQRERIEGGVRLFRSDPREIDIARLTKSFRKTILALTKNVLDCIYG